MLFAGVALATAPAFFSNGPSAHCPSSPDVKMEYPSTGVAIQEACYPGFNTCLVDTFYTDKLRTHLVESYKASRYAIFAFVDSVNNYLTFDTVLYHGEPYYVDTFQTEKVWITVTGSLKDPLPTEQLSYIDRWPAFKNNPFATTYIPLADTPFVTFFNAYDSIRNLGIGPMDGCFFEPTANTIIGDRIHKKGLAGERMPGVSLAMEDFFKAIGHDPVEVPKVRPKSNSIRRRNRLMPALLPGEGIYRYDLNGRRFEAGKARGRTSSLWSLPWSGPGNQADDGVSKP